MKFFFLSFLLVWNVLVGDKKVISVETKHLFVPLNQALISKTAALRRSETCFYAVG